MWREFLHIIRKVLTKPSFAKALCVFAVALGSFPASSQDGQTSTWVVEPLNKTATVEIGRGAVARLETRLLPVRLALLDYDLIDGQGKPLAIAGSQLIWVPRNAGLGNRSALFCQMRNTKYAREGSWRASVNSNKLICFSDDDGDGSFETYRYCTSQYPSLLNDGKCRDEIVPLAGATYREVDRGEFKSDLIVGLNVTGKGELVQCVRHVPDCQPLTGVQDIADLPAGARVSWLGSDLRILGRDKDSVTTEIIPIAQPRVMMLNAPWVLFDVRL